jgi:hypothetical protein
MAKSSAAAMAARRARIMTIRQELVLMLVSFVWQ